MVKQTDVLQGRTKKSKVINEGSKHLFSKEMQDVYEHVFKKAKTTILCPDKYYAAQKSMLLEWTREIFQSSPKLY
ncbi:MAG TPA: hypothetical protein ENJ95_14240 [Bacteroidetes bacterium]|nr:hypothetical protein [Bacteroidota bacterium]